MTLNLFVFILKIVDQILCVTVMIKSSWLKFWQILSFDCNCLATGTVKGMLLQKINKFCCNIFYVMLMLLAFVCFVYNALCLLQKMGSKETSMRCVREAGRN